MAQITKTVDRTLVNGSEVFIYTVNAAFSGLIQPAQEGKIVDIFPSIIKFTLPPAEGQIKSITQTPVTGGTEVTFHLGPVNAGTSLSFTIACWFGPGRADGDIYINDVDLIADDVIVAQASAPPVTLRLDENFLLSKSVQPSSLVRPGAELTFSLTLSNNDDPGAEINNIVIVDTLPAQLIPVLSYTPIGNDVPTGGFSDPSANGLTGTWSGNTLTFQIPKYSGARYVITFKATVSENVTPGEQFVNIATWTVDGNARANAPLTLNVYNPATDAFGLYKLGPRTTIIGAPISFDVYNSNATGDMVLNGYVLEDTIPSQMDVDHYRLTASAGLVNYSISIALDSSPANYIYIVQNVPSGSQPLTDLTPYIPAGDRIAKIKLEAQSLNPSASSHILSIFGFTNETAVLGERLINSATATSGSISRTASWSVVVSGASDLSIVKSFNPSLAAYHPTEEFDVHLKASARNTMTVEPIIIDLMPNGLRYLSNSAYFKYYDYMTGIVYDSRQAGFPIPIPMTEILPDFAGTGQTLLRWHFPFILPNGGSVEVIFKAFVEINAPNTFTNKAYEGMPGIDVVFVDRAVDDPLDMDGDGYTTTDRLSSSELSGVVLTTSEFSLVKRVKGERDLEYVSSGTTVQGGNIDYRLQVTNNQELDLKDIEIVDILPYIGDTGVILTDQQRGSQFNVHATSTVTATIINILGEPVDPDPEIVIEYSTSNNPKRFDQLGNPIGDGDWSLIPPPDITTLRSIRVTTGPAVILKPYDRLLVDFAAKAPVNVVTGRTAYNSYAVRANKIVGGVPEPLLPTEPNRVSVTIAAPILGMIGDFVWEDLNHNGLYDPSEPGVNGVTVELYSAGGTLLASTVTADNASGDPGYYLFTDLPNGIYQVKFIPFGPYTLTIQQAEQPNGSKPNPSTGLTSLITISGSQQILDIDAGVVSEVCNPPVIEASDRCIHVGAAFDPMAGVTATDCLGADITDRIIIIENTVNTEVPGVYTVIYEVTDERGLTSRKEITVRVCKNGVRQQAVTDLLNSVALEQASIAAILNSEGRKIQRAKDLDFSERELVKINSSAGDMIGSVTRLEMVLQSKMELFEDCICHGDCCEHD